jgi:serine/threonine-protein kinase RsbW
LGQPEPSVAQQTLSREFVFTGNLEALPPARDAIMDFVHEHCGDEQQEIDILVALQEALANAMKHGCENDAGKSVHCTVDVTPTAFEFVIQDPGSGFDTASMSDVSEDGTNLTQHGRGIMMIRSLMDEISYRNRGSQLRMKKLRKLPAIPAHA